MSPDRSFYGGDAPGHSQGEISGGVYDGPKLYPEHAPWQCPACKAENSGPLEQGCVSCGSGSIAARHVGVPPRQQQLVNDRSQQLSNDLSAKMQTGVDVFLYAQQWWAANPDATPADAFVAGYKYARGQTMAAPPVAVDVQTLAPEGKARRTIRAALEYFREQILPRATEEIAAGEWCSLEEMDQLIRSFTDEESGS